MKKYLGLISALTFAAFTLTPLATVYGLGEAQTAKEITQEEAAQKYPAPSGKSYPPGVATSTSTGGFIQSPYSSRVYDCRKIKHGHLVLDEGVNKVFVRP